VHPALLGFRDAWLERGQPQIRPPCLGSRTPDFGAWSLEPGALSPRS